jgi:CheY-like chemotaxis protein/GAF domain-containing protein
MTRQRPRLLLVAPGSGGAEASSLAQSLALLLGQVADVTVAPAGELAGALETGVYDQVVMAPGALTGLAQRLGDGRRHDLLEGLGDGAVLVDVDGRVLWCNDRFLRYDTGTQSRVARACRQALRAMVDPARTAAESGGAGDGRSARIEVPGADDGVFLEVIVTPLAGDEHDAHGRGSVRVIAGVVSDVSVQRRRRGKLAAIERAGKELVGIDGDTVRTLHTGERLRVLEQKIIKIAHDLLSFDHFAIRLIEARTGKLELVMSRGLPSVAMEVELFAKPEGNGISGYVAATGRSYVCRDTRTDPRYVVGVEGAASSLTVPLRLSDRVIGVFNVESVRPAAFGEEDREYAEQLAVHIALALHILDLLVIERSETGQTVGHTVEDELAEPLADLAADIGKLKAAAPSDAAALQRLVDRLSKDLASLQQRVKDVTSGPQTILGAEKALSDVTIDPLMAGRRALIADDEPRVRQIIRDVLSSRGMEVVVCENATEAIEALTRPGALRDVRPGQERDAGAQGAGPRPFDLLISDIRLPDKTGYEIFAAAKGINSGLPVILMTGFGYDPHHSIVRASQEGLQCVLFKPFQAERLIEEVHKALSKRAGGA